MSFKLSVYRSPANEHPDKELASVEVNPYTDMEDIQKNGASAIELDGTRVISPDAPSDIGAVLDYAVEKYRWLAPHAISNSNAFDFNNKKYYFLCVEAPKL